MNSDPTPLFVQDVIELLTNIKLKYGNLPVYNFTDDQMMQDDDINGIHYKKKEHDLPERVEIT